MRTIAYKGRGGDEEHTIFTPDEALETNLHVVANWRAGEEMQWVATDDGFVVQVLKAGRLGDGTRWVRTCIGTYRALQRERLDTTERACRYTFNGQKPGGLHKKVTRSVEQFGKLVARGMVPADAYQASFPRSSRRNAERRSQWLLKKEEVRQVVADELGDIMDRLGITQAWILEQFIDIATTVGDKSINARVSALKELATMRGMVGRIKETKTLRFTGIPANRLAAVEASTRDRHLEPAFEALSSVGLDLHDGMIADGIPAPEFIDEASFEVTIEETSCEIDP